MCKNRIPLFPHHTFVSSIGSNQKKRPRQKQVKNKIMKIRNHVQLIGRLGADPEVKVFDNGNKVARFSIAVAESYTNKDGERVTDVQWHSIVAWNGLAGIAEKVLQKGTQVAVDGKLVRKAYTGKDGARRSANEIIAHELLVTRKVAA
jgi:single-strand DNA-binding protein